MIVNEDELRHYYIGAVSLLVRLWNSIGLESQESLEYDFGDSMTRLAADFNSKTYHLEMVPNGSRGWMIVDRDSNQSSFTSEKSGDRINPS